MCFHYRCGAAPGRAPHTRLTHLVGPAAGLRPTDAREAGLARLIDVARNLVGVVKAWGRRDGRASSMSASWLSRGGFGGWGLQLSFLTLHPLLLQLLTAEEHPSARQAAVSDAGLGHLAGGAHARAVDHNSLAAAGHDGKGQGGEGRSAGSQSHNAGDECLGGKGSPRRGEAAAEGLSSGMRAVEQGQHTQQMMPLPHARTGGTKPRSPNTLITNRFCRALALAQPEACTTARQLA